MRGDQRGARKRNSDAAGTRVKGRIRGEEVEIAEDSGQPLSPQLNCMRFSVSRGFNYCSVRTEARPINITGVYLLIGAPVQPII